MALHHIIPKFILRNFVINPERDKKEQEVMVYDRNKKEYSTEKIKTAYAIENFNSEETEKSLCNDYENKVAIIFNRVKNVVNNNGKEVILNNGEYKLLFRFFTIMWRRNNIHAKKYMPIIKELFSQNSEVFKKLFYDSLISTTNDDDQTIQKTIKNYSLIIVFNKTKTHFLLHNLYGTLTYLTQSDCFPKENDMPFAFMEPISPNLMFYLIYNNNSIDIDRKIYNIPIEIFDDEDFVIEHFIKGYIIPTSESFVVDESNKKIVKQMVDNI